MAFGDSYSAVQQAALAEAAQRQQANQFATQFAANQLNRLRAGNQLDRQQAELKEYRNRELASRYALPGIANELAMKRDEENWKRRKAQWELEQGVLQQQLEEEAAARAGNLQAQLTAGVDIPADIERERVQEEADRMVPSTFSKLFRLAAGGVLPSGTGFPAARGANLLMDLYGRMRRGQALTEGERAIEQQRALGTAAILSEADTTGIDLLPGPNGTLVPVPKVVNIPGAPVREQPPVPQAPPYYTPPAQPESGSLMPSFLEALKWTFPGATPSPAPAAPAAAAPAPRATATPPPTGAYAIPGGGAYGSPTVPNVGPRQAPASQGARTAYTFAPVPPGTPLDLDTASRILIHVAGEKTAYTEDDKKKARAFAESLRYTTR